MNKIKYAYLVLARSILCVMITSASVVYADGFYTIIGPDGRPMVIPKKEQEKTLANLMPKVAPTEQVKPKPTKAAPSTLPSKPQSAKTVANVPETQPDRETKKIAQSDQLKIQPSVVSASVSTTEPTSQNATVLTPSKPTLKHSQTPLEVEKPIAVKTTQQVPEVTVQPTEISHQQNTDETDEFSQIDGIEYVNNEYLEEQEFNLDGKKRFYSMPDGLGRVETIERKKGVGRSILDQVMKRPQQAAIPVTLSANYVRLSAQELSVAFERERCFVEQYPKSKSIKHLKPKKNLGIWPTKPLKEKFEYELVKLDKSIQYIQLDSYASNIDNPVYYWPLIIFLDDQGCIQEGVSGFKNKIIAATLLQHAALQGVLKVPPKASYLMMTPLESAVDVTEQKLSNQGQIRISVLK